jgi:hypothetical protein
MSQRAATITTLPIAFEIVKAMQADGLDWGEGYRPLGRQALEEIIEDQMAADAKRSPVTLVRKPPHGANLAGDTAPPLSGHARFFLKTIRPLATWRSSRGQSL